MYGIRAGSRLGKRREKRVQRVMVYASGSIFLKAGWHLRPNLFFYTSGGASGMACSHTCRPGAWSG